MGAAATVSRPDVQMIVFLAIMLHKVSEYVIEHVFNNEGWSSVYLLGSVLAVFPKIIVQKGTICF